MVIADAEHEMLTGDNVEWSSNWVWRGHPWQHSLSPYRLLKTFRFKFSHITVHPLNIYRTSAV